MEKTAKELYDKMTRDSEGIVRFSLNGLARKTHITKQKAKSQISSIVNVLGITSYSAGGSYQNFKVIYAVRGHTTYGYFRPVGIQ